MLRFRVRIKVLVPAYTTIIVQARNQESAVKKALKEAPNGEFDVDWDLVHEYKAIDVSEAKEE